MKRIAAALLAAGIIIFSAQPYFAEEVESEISSETAENTPKRLVALGDSITKGYGLSDDEKSYVDILTQEGGFESENLAVNGRTSGTLLEGLENSSESEKAVLEQADYIVISVGGNDMLYLLNSLVDGALPSDSMDKPLESINNLIDMAKNLTAESISSDIAYYKSTVEKSIKLLREMNPDAEIVMQTVYDPFKPIFVVAPVVFSNIADDIKSAHANVDNCISGFNSALSELSEEYDFKLADVFGDFKESSKNYLNMSLSNPDIHPNAAGHRRIAEIIEQTIDPQGTIFTASVSESSLEESTEAVTAEIRTSSESAESEQTSEGSELSSSSSAESSEEEYSQRLLIIIIAMAVISFSVTFYRLKKSK